MPPHQHPHKPLRATLVLALSVALQLPPLHNQAPLALRLVDAARSVAAHVAVGLEL